MPGLIMGQPRRKKKKYNLTQLEEKRLEHFRCSGMHCKAVQDILDEVAVYDRCRWWWNVLNPASGLEFVTPALTVGIQEQLERLNTATSEIAIYAALTWGLFAGAYLSGFSPSNAKITVNQRDVFYSGYIIGINCFIINMASSIIFRISSASLARESDMLVFISKTRYWHMINIGLFVFACVQSIASFVTAVQAYYVNGDYCLQGATGGSMGFLTWWMEWMFNEFPTGRGAFYAKGELIRNPWAKMADTLNISRPSKLPSKSLLYGTEMASALEPKDKENFEVYLEFMHGHFDLKGFDCYGRDDAPRYWVLILVLLLPLVVFFFLRNSRFYWLVGPSCCGNDDPYDMTHVFHDFKERAKIGERLAARDRAVSGQSDGFIDVNTEMSDDSDHEEVGGPDQEERRGGGGNNYNSLTTHMTVNSSPIVYTEPPKLYTNNDPGATVITPMPVPRSVFLNSSVSDCVCVCVVCVQ
jgi:hypothetical protein